MKIQDLQCPTVDFSAAGTRRGGLILKRASGNFVLRTCESERLFSKGVAQCNRGDFFESHHTWEELLRETTCVRGTFLQGLIQTAAGYHHASCGKYHAAVGRISHGLRERAETKTGAWEVDVDALRREVAPHGGSYERTALDSDSPVMDINIPKIKTISPSPIHYGDSPWPS